MPEVLVSILLPIHNGETWLKECLDSLCGQTLTNWELIAINDGSTDQTEAILHERQRSDPRIKPLRLPQPSGIVAALNTAIEQACGSWIARMDADDIAHPERLQRQLDWMSARPNLALCGTNAQLIDPEGREIGPLNPPAQHDEILAQLCYGHATALLHPALFAQGDAMRALRYREAYRHVEDLDLYLRAAAEGYRLGNLSDYTGLFYRQHARSVNVQQMGRQQTLKQQLLQEMESTGQISVQWDAFARASAAQPSHLADIYCRWAWMAGSQGRGKQCLGYLLQARRCPPSQRPSLRKCLALYRTARQASRKA